MAKKTEQIFKLRADKAQTKHIRNNLLNWNLKIKKNEALIIYLELSRQFL